jgi:solute carrier family 45, member 1/2/4
MSKSVLAFVWAAGPLSGTLVQPYIGVRSDNCRISWGKRKPFMIGGGLATVVCLLALAWVREVAAVFLSVLGVAASDEDTKITVIVLATFWMYALDFSINTGKLYIVVLHFVFNVYYQIYDQYTINI